MYNRFQMEVNAMFQILIAEDDKNTRKLMEAVLKCNGFNPIPASSGEEALKLLDRHHICLLYTSRCV